MELKWREVDTKFGSAEETLEVPAGKTFKIEVSPNGTEVLKVLTPTGKMITYRIVVVATETSV